MGPQTRGERDQWSQSRVDTLVRLLLDAHGESWENHDHTEKLASRDKVHFTARPAQLGSDVALVKSALADFAVRGKNPGMNSDFLHGLLLCGMHRLPFSPWAFVMWNASSHIFRMDFCYVECIFSHFLHGLL